MKLTKAQIRLERNTAERVKRFEEVTVNLTVKILLAEIRFDTEKHAKILQTMLDLMEEVEEEPVAGHL